MYINKIGGEIKSTAEKVLSERYVSIFNASITDAAEREQRVTAHYAEPRGGKALVEGLTQ